MYEDLKGKLKQFQTNYSGKDFWSIVNQVKKDRIEDDELLTQIEHIRRQKFMERIPISSFTLSVPAGNVLECILTIAALIMAFKTGSDRMLYVSAFILLATLHPLSHYAIGSLFGIRFTHYYLNGPARIEPTLRIDYLSYLKASGGKRALMHASGVIGTVAAPLVVALIALIKGIDNAAFYLFIMFLLLIVFELLTSTKSGDLMRAKREYGYR